MTKEKSGGKNFDSNLKKLSKISDWFTDQEEIDIEEGLRKIKEAVVLIKTSKERLREIENEFEEIKKEIDSEDKKNEEAF